MSTWQEALVGKVLLHREIGFVARCVRAHAPGTHKAPEGLGNGSPVDCWVLEFDDGGALIAADEGVWEALPTLVGAFYDGVMLATKTVVNMMGVEARRSKIPPGHAVRIICMCLARQANVLEAGAKRLETKREAGDGGNEGDATG